MQNKKYFCYEIYKNLAIWSFNGNLSYNPCSFYSGYIKTSNTFDIAQVWNSPEHNQLKSMVDQDLPIPGCSACYDAEKNGLKSRRLGAKELYEDYFQDSNVNLTGPQSIDYSVGNLCNLKCVICGPQNSSAWIGDYQKIYPERNIERLQYDKFNQIQIDQPDLLKNIKNVHFHGGGEPLLSNNHINLLEKIKEVKGLQDVHVIYNTNGTKRASEKLLNLWAECQLVELYFSIDDVGERFNYQRTGAIWNEVVENLKWYKENMPVNHMFKINCTWGYLNLFYLNELVNWHKNHFNANRLGDPIELIFQKVVNSDFSLSLDFVSTKLKNIMFDKFKNYPELTKLVMSLETNDDKTHNKFWQSIQKIDSVRASGFRDICPDLASLLS
jgi:MoaA/NifB/PqqE/SkfB family radical SAM enzyme